MEGGEGGEKERRGLTIDDNAKLAQLASLPR